MLNSETKIRCGHLFQERFKSEIVSTDSYFLTALRYIHQNPIKAKIVEDISHYKWSSYGEYFGQGHIVDKEHVLGMFSDTSSEALRLFEIFSREMITEVCLDVEETKQGISDVRLREILKEKFGIDSIKLANEERKRQEEILKELKQLKGTSIRQIARTTGVSQTRVWKA